ncbi:MAG: Sodium/potassium-transporting ATPase subunit alpha-4 [Marteilia pararefringens]
MMGRIANLTSSLKEKKTLIAKEISEFLKIIMAIAVFLGIFVAIYMTILGQYYEVIGYTVSIIVANVPEGLLLTVTVSLSLAAKTMNKRNCRVKDLKCVETLGSVSCICSDKTGTLTENKMSVSNLFFDLEIKPKVNPLSPQGLTGYEESISWRNLMKISALCNCSEFLSDDKNLPISERSATGDGSEKALLKYCEEFFSPVSEYRKSNPKLGEIPFNSTNKYQVSIHQDQKNDQKIFMMMKGAPEKILNLCTTISLDKEDAAIDGNIKKRIEEACLNLSNKGERVLGFCDKSEINVKLNADGKIEDSDFPKITNMRFCGFISMIDPPRVSVPKSILECQRAGIKIAMVTGDHQNTAKAIAKKIHLIDDKSKSAEEEALELMDMYSHQEFYKKLIRIAAEKGSHSITINGEFIEFLNDQQLEEICEAFHEIVFARTSPQQKLRIVEAMQNVGYVTVVTGDGVNDAPALKKADVGIAMGISGTDVSKESADIELMDDNFASIVAGIEEGRRLFDNLKKSIVYTLTSNIPEIMPLIVSLIWRSPIVLGAIPVLLIDVGTDLVPAISLAYEKPELDIMSQKPRNPLKDKLVTKKLIGMAYVQIGFIQFIAAFTSYLYWMKLSGLNFYYLRKTFDKWLDKDILFKVGSDYFSYKDRLHLQYAGHSTFILAIIIVQYADLLISKTRRLSLFQHGLLSTNSFMLIAILIETLLGVIFVYLFPLIHDAVPLRMPPYQAWLVPIPFAISIFLYDEVRKLLMRRFPKSVGKLLHKVTYY